MHGVDAVEAMLDRGLSYASGPGWLSEHVLRRQHVLAVAGTHGKTTTTALAVTALRAIGLDRPCRQGHKGTGRVIESRNMYSCGP